MLCIEYYQKVKKEEEEERMLSCVSSFIFHQHTPCREGTDEVLRISPRCDVTGG